MFFTLCLLAMITGLLAEILRNKTFHRLVNCFVFGRIAYATIAVITIGVFLWKYRRDDGVTGNATAPASWPALSPLPPPVMAGLVASLPPPVMAGFVASPPSWPALCRPSTPLLRSLRKGVDGRHKAGHDGGGGEATSPRAVTGGADLRLPVVPRPPQAGRSSSRIVMCSENDTSPSSSSQCSVPRNSSRRAPPPRRRAASGPRS